MYPYYNLRWNPGLFVPLVLHCVLHRRFPFIPGSRAPISLSSKDGKRPFHTQRFASLPTASTHFKVFSLLFPPILDKLGEATSEACVLHNNLLKDGFLSLTQRDAVRRHFSSSSEHRGPQGKAYCPQIDPTPLWFCLFK